MGPIVTYVIVNMLILSLVGAIDLPLVSAAPKISVSPSDGHVGETVEVKGSGFTPLSSIDILFDGTKVVTEPENIAASLSGQFDARFVVPKSVAGSVTVTASERILDNSASTEFTVLNDPPVAEDLAVSTDEGSEVEITLNATDNNGDPLIFAITKDPEHGTLKDFDEASGAMTYVPDDNYSGDDVFMYKVSDGLQDSNKAEVSISVAPVNHPPLAKSQELSVNENGELNITLSASDPDSDELTFTITEEPASGELTGDAPNLVYRPSPGFSGSDGFSFMANDGAVDSKTARVDITVLSVNHAPSVRDIPVETNEDESVTVTLTATDPDSDELTFEIMSQPTHGTLGQIKPANSTSATVTYTPMEGYSGTDGFTFSASDGNERSGNGTVNVSIRPVNDSPIVHSQNVSATAGQQTEITLSGTDPDGDSLAFEIVEGAKQGTLGSVISTSDTSATISYTPNSGAAGSDSFTFRASDGVDSSGPATISITISGNTSSGSSSSSSGDSQNANPSGGTTSGGTENSGSSSGAGNANNNPSSGTIAPGNSVEADRTIHDVIPIQEDSVGVQAQNNMPATTQGNTGASSQGDIPGQGKVESLAATTIGDNPFMRGYTTWLLPGAIAGVTSVVALLGYRQRRLKKSSNIPQAGMTSPVDQRQITTENTFNELTGSDKLSGRITNMVNMNRIHKILNNEKGKAAREMVLNVEYNKSQTNRKEYENSKSVVMNEFEQIGSVLRSYPSLKESFLESFGDLAIKVWWAIKQDVRLDERRGKRWNSLEWLGNEIEKYWSSRSRTSSQTS